MLLTQILHKSCIKVPIQGKSKEAVIAELIELLYANGSVASQEAVFKAVMNRECTRSTGTGGGIAIPHGKCDGVKELVLAMGVTTEPINFDSVDGEPVRIVILLVSPSDQIEPHIKALSSISRLAIDDELKMEIEKARSAKEVYELLESMESGVN